MSINADEVLDVLDRHINDGPMMFQLWTHFFLADTRLSVFRSKDEWAVFIEIVCFRPGQEDSSLETWCYGNCLSEPALLWYDTPYRFCQIDEDNPKYSTYPETPFQFCVDWDNKRLEFSPTPEECAALGIVIAPDIKEQGNHVGAHILRFLCERLNHPFFAPESALRQLLEESWHEDETPRVGEMALLWQTQRWRHPAITGAYEGEERPRVLPYFHALAQGIETGSITELEQQDPITFNTDWRIWDAEEREEEAELSKRQAGPIFGEVDFDQLTPEVQEQIHQLYRDKLGNWKMITTIYH